MAGTFSQIYIQIVFAVKGRQNFIPDQHKEELFQYMAGIVRNKGQKPIIINGTNNHVHVFVGIKPNLAVSDLVRDIKANSSKFVNEKKWIQQKFAWQEGFGSFSYSESQIENVYNYILNQEEHHKRLSFKDEYIEFLKKFKIDYEEKYLFDFFTD